MISIVVPCYNEEEAIPFFYPELKKYLDEIPETYEILFVDDGSKDRTVEEALKLKKNDENIKVISFSRNLKIFVKYFCSCSNSAGEILCSIQQGCCGNLSPSPIPYHLAPMRIDHSCSTPSLCQP